jgi:hypothetical protein
MWALKSVICFHILIGCKQQSSLHSYDTDMIVTAAEYLGEVGQEVYYICPSEFHLRINAATV